MSSHIEKIKSINSEAIEDWRAFLELLKSIKAKNNETLDFNATVPGTSRTILETDKSLIALSALVAGLDPNVDQSAIPSTYLNSLHSFLGQITNDVLQIRVRISDVEEDDDDIGEIDNETFTITSVSELESINLASSLKNINSHIDNSLNTYYQYSSIVNSTKYDAFTSAVNHLSGRLMEAEETANSIKSILNSSEEALKEIAELSEAGFKKLNSAVSSDKQTKELVANIAERDETSLTALASITETESLAQGLSSKVDSYNSEFEEFEEEMTKRITSHQKQDKESKELIAVLNAHIIKVAGLTSQADTMLQGATNASLAGTFETIKSGLEEKLSQAQWHFYFAIAVLLASTIPLANYLYTNTLASAASGEATITIELSKIIGFAVLMIPAIWATKFIAAKHAALFKLKESYAYKYSIAMGVDGFKKQSPDYADEIAAASFFELTFNPADKMVNGHDADAHPNPVMEWITNKLGINHDGEAK